MGDSLRFIDCEPLKDEIARLTAELAASRARERVLREAGNKLAAELLPDVFCACSDTRCVARRESYAAWRALAQEADDEH